MIALELPHQGLQESLEVRTPFPGFLRSFLPFGTKMALELAFCGRQRHESDREDHFAFLLFTHKSLKIEDQLMLAVYNSQILS
jgi:hypothetical protein